MDTATPTPPGSPHTGPATDRPVMLDAPALAQLREDFGGDWDIARALDGWLIAEHRYERPDKARERWVLKTRVRAANPESMHVALCIQQAVRGAEVPQ